MARRAAEFGVWIEGRVGVDMKQVKARVDRVTERSRMGLEALLNDTPDCTFHQGHARFESPREVRVGEAVLSAERIFINVGGRARVPRLRGIERIGYYTNSSMMAVDFTPHHLVIVGGGYVGLEFAQVYRRFGSEVTVVEMAARLIPREDEDVSAAVKDILEREGVEVRLNAKCIGMVGRGGGIEVTVDCDSGAPVVSGSHVLLAAGRWPNTDDLGLQEAGVAVDEHGYIAVDDQLRTNVPGIWALGDCNGKGAFTHTAYNDFEIVAANLLDGDSRRVSDRITAYALYTDPPLGRAGLTEAEVRAQGRNALVGQRPMTRVGRAVEKGETQGFMKILVDADSKQILGAAMLGTGGDEVIHSVLDMMYAKAPCSVMERAVHIHPTVSELLPTVLQELRPLGISGSAAQTSEPSGKR